MKIGLVAGGFKPYHKGHHFLVEKASRENDRVIIITSVKSREDLKGESMSKVWKEIIVPLMPLQNVDLEIVTSPVSATFDHLDSLVDRSAEGVEYNIYGGAQDLEKRFPNDYMLNRYGALMTDGSINLTPVVRGDDSPDASGTAMRDQLGNLAAFREGLPKFLKPKASLIMQYLL